MLTYLSYKYIFSSFRFNVESVFFPAQPDPWKKKSDPLPCFFVPKHKLPNFQHIFSISWVTLFLMHIPNLKVRYICKMFTIGYFKQFSSYILLTEVNLHPIFSRNWFISYPDQDQHFLQDRIRIQLFYLKKVRLSVYDNTNCCF